MISFMLVPSRQAPIFCQSVDDKIQSTENQYFCCVCMCDGKQPRAQIRCHFLINAVYIKYKCTINTKNVNTYIHPYIKLYIVKRDLCLQAKHLQQRFKTCTDEQSKVNRHNSGVFAVIVQQTVERQTYIDMQANMRCICMVDGIPQNINTYRLPARPAVNTMQ